MPGPFVPRGPQPRALALGPRGTWERKGAPWGINRRERPGCTWAREPCTGEPGKKGGVSGFGRRPKRPAGVAGKKVLAFSPSPTCVSGAGRQRAPHMAPRCPCWRRAGSTFRGFFFFLLLLFSAVHFRSSCRVSTCAGASRWMNRLRLYFH